MLPTILTDDWIHGSDRVNIQRSSFRCSGWKLIYINKTKSFSIDFCSLVSGTPSVTPPTSPSRRNSDNENDSTASLKLPTSAYYIIFVEGCERFCYYGLRAILLLYFMQFLRLDKDSATVGYHLFSSACYFTPILGAIISDGFIGRYWTILSLSIVYFFGTVILSITAIPKIGAKHLYV